MKLVTARKVHACDACGWPIYRGERYNPVTCTPWCHPDNDGFSNYKFCRFCAESGFLFPADNDYLLNPEIVLDLHHKYVVGLPDGPKPLVYQADGWWDSDSWAGSIQGWMDDLRAARKVAWAEARA